MEHPKIKFTRAFCKQNNIKYQIKGPNDALYLFNNNTKKYIQVCYTLLNLSTDQISEMIQRFYN